MFTKKSVYILIPGIHTKPNDNDNWAPSFSDDINMFTESAVGTEYRYLSRFASRRLTQEKHKNNIIRIIEDYRRSGHFENIYLVGHSNGCDLISRILKDYKKSGVIKDIHLIGGAVDKDFDINGFNEALLKNKIENVNCYCSKLDSTLSGWAAWSKTILGWMGLGYGNLGYTGPININKKIKDKVKVFWKPEKDYNNESDFHSKWFKEDFYWYTFTSVTHKEDYLPFIVNKA